MSPEAHAKYGPSSMARIIACPGSVKLSEQAPQGTKESPYAAEGTAAHNLAEAILLEEPYANWPEHDEEMVAAVEHYTNYCDDLLNGADHYGIEAKLFGDEELFGTADCWALDGRTLHVVDYKHGAGVDVDPEENKQALTYAALIFMDEQTGVKASDVDEVVLTIVQPRTPGQTVKSWACDTKRVQKHMHQVDAAINSSKLETPPIAMGDHCKWCRAKLLCPAILKAEQGVAAFDVNDVDPGLLQSMLDAVKPIEAKIKELKSYALERMESGESIPEWKMVQIRPRQLWTNDDDLHKWAKRNGFLRTLYQTKPLTPLQAIKILPDDYTKSIGKIIEKKSSGLTIAPRSDKRKEVDSIASNLAAMAARVSA